MDKRQNTFFPAVRVGRAVFFRVVGMLVCLALLFGALAEGGEIRGIVDLTDPDILKKGNITLAIPADSIYEVFSQGDIAEVTVESFGTFEVPVCGSYDDVAAGQSLLRARPGADHLTLGVNYGHFGLDIGLLEKAPEGSDTPYVLTQVEEPIEVVIRFKAAGEANANALGALIRTNVREDYPDLTDAQFANFRAVQTTGMAEGVLYRSTSPIDPDIRRNTFADAAAKSAGIRGFVNLSDSEAFAHNFPGYDGSYYAGQDHIFLSLSMDIFGDGFRSGFAEGCRFIATHEGPYLVHCLEGKDRTGLTIAILESLTGARLDEITDDYTETYRNFFSVENGAHRPLTQAEEDAARNTILNNLKNAFGTEIDENTDLAAEAEAYLLEAGLAPEELQSLKARLMGEN